MGIQKTQYQGGSIASFVVIAIVASILLIGGAAWLRHRSESARQVAVTTEEQGDEQPTGAESDESAETSGEGSQSASEEESIFGESSTSTSSESPAPANTDSDSASSGSSESAAPVATGSADASSPSNLPQSGPGELMASMVVMAAVTYAAASYVASRREVGQSSHKSSF